MQKPKFIIETTESVTNPDETRISSLVLEIDNLRVELTRLVSDEITDFRMFDPEKKIAELTCKNVEGEIRYALVSAEDELLIMENIIEVQSYLKKQGLFILELEQMEADLLEELKKTYEFTSYSGPNPIAVVDVKGNYVLKPFFGEITWKPEEGLFYARELVPDTLGNSIYNLEGERAGEFEF